MIKPRSLMAALAVGTLMFAACSNDSTDFKETAEKAIDKDDRFDDAECEKPSSTKVDTTFPCTATEKETGATVNFVAEITKKDFVEVSQVLGTDSGTPTSDDTVTSDDTGTADTTLDTVTDETTSTS